MASLLYNHLLLVLVSEELRSICTDTIFGPECGPCPAGYSGDGKKNNCTVTCALDVCFEGVECTDTPTGPVCGSCPVGYQGNGKECIDIDEVRFTFCLDKAGL